MIIEIIFDNAEKSYHAGQTVTGYVKLKLKKKKTLTSISVTFRGYSYCSWFEQRGRKRAGRYEFFSENFTGTQIHFDEKIILHGQKNGTPFSLSDGSHTYKFKYHLNRDLPSTLSDEYGYTLYIVKAKASFSAARSCKKKESFTVLSTLDLNKIKESREVFRMELEKYIGYWIFKSGPLKAVVKAPHSGFIAGNVAPFFIEVENHTKNRVTSVKLQIIQVIKHTAAEPYFRQRKSKNVIKQLNFGRVEQHTNRSINASIHIPVIPPTGGNSVNEIYYTVTAILTIAGWHKDLKSTHPIVIGTVPLKKATESSLFMTNFQNSDFYKKVSFGKK